MAAYLTAMAISAGIYALLALGVNLTWGMAGMINLGLAGFFAVGGYATALLTKAGVKPDDGVVAPNKGFVKAAGKRYWDRAPGVRKLPGQAAKV